jgi:hypothetical protein
MRANPLKDKFDPSFKKSNTEIEDPKRQKLLSDTVEPRAV